MGTHKGPTFTHAHKDDDSYWCYCSVTFYLAETLHTEIRTVGEPTYILSK